MTYEQRIRQELERVVGTGEWIGLHCNPESPDAFIVGSVARLARETVVVNTASTDGQDDGTETIAIETVVGLTFGGSYLECPRTLRASLSPPRRLLPDDPGIEGTLRAAQAEGLAVNVKFPDETIGGFVREVGEGWAALDDVDEDDGTDEGLRIVSLEAVERVFVGGSDEMRLQALARARKLRDSM